MQFVEMGNPSGKTLMLLPGTACDYQTNFAAVLDRLGEEIDRYVRGSERSKKREYPMDWVFDFSYDLSVPEYYVTHRECGV